jgi:hypothetical protein
MADIISIGTTEDTGKGKALNTGGLRRTYNTKKRKKKKKKKSSGIKFRNGNSKYKVGK